MPGRNRYWTCNLAAVWGQMATGGGYNDLQESMSTLGVPVMAKKTFITTERRIEKWWWDLLQEAMSASGREERELAIQQNCLDNDKIPTITVMVDGGWSKRTHI